MIVLIAGLTCRRRVLSSMMRKSSFQPVIFVEW